MEKYLVPLRKPLEVEPPKPASPLTDIITSKAPVIYHSHPPRKKRKVVDEEEFCSDSENTNQPEQIQIQTFPVSKITWKRWEALHPWISLNSCNKAVCSVCKEAVEKGLFLERTSTSSSGSASLEAFVTTGFSGWKNAASRFSNHESSAAHKEALTAINALNTKGIVHQLSTAKQKEMADSRTALGKIFSAIRFLGQQGLAFRGDNNDETSNLQQLLQLRAEDVPELNMWLKRDKGKWLSHDIVNEIIKLMADNVLRQNLAIVKEGQYYALMIDETSDISRLEQVSVCLRVVHSDLSVEEIFTGFYSTDSTTSEALFNVVKDVLIRYGLKFEDMRGQCYDGAANVSGRITGLQARIKEVEPRALYVHCTAHTLNLAVQDAMEQVLCVKNFLGILKDLINFIRDSPKRLAKFTKLQSAGNPNLKAFCPTRWCVRVKSLTTVRENYTVIMEFLDNTRMDPQIDKSVSAKIDGFFRHMESFEFLFLLTLSIEIFEPIEILNAELQGVDLCLNGSHDKVRMLKEILNATRDTKFSSIWKKATDCIASLDIENPKIPRLRKISKRLDRESVSEAHVFRTPEEYYRKIYYEVFDQVVMSLNTRFVSETMTFLDRCENFVLGRGEVTVEEITDMYNAKSFEMKLTPDFNSDVLERQRSNFLEFVAQRGVNIESLKDVVKFLRENIVLANMNPEFTKLIRILLTVPASTCTNERSFSMLRRLKTYLRSTMLQSRLNHIAMLHTYRETASNLDLDVLMNEFITQKKKRRDTFAVIPVKTDIV